MLNRHQSLVLDFVCMYLGVCVCVWGGAHPDTLLASHTENSWNRRINMQEGIGQVDWS